MNKLLGVIIAILLSASVFAQSKVLFAKKQHDFGQIISMDFPPATFKFKNNTNKPLAIITTKSAYETKVQYQSVYIDPGETGMIYVRYESQQLGEFNDEIQVFFNVMPEPVRLSIKGEIISVAECFHDKNRPTIRKVTVIDVYTKEPIPGAQTYFLLNGMKEITAVMDEDGEKLVDLPIGMYEIDLKAEGYKPRSLSKFIQKSVPVLFFEMEPLPKVVEVIPPVEPEPEPETVAIEETVFIPDENEEINEPEPVVEEPEAVVENTVELPVELYASNNIVFVIDISLSMKKNNKMTYLKRAMFDLVNVLRKIDNVTIITYNNDAYVNIEAITGNNKTILKKTIRELYPEGLTNGVKGLDLAYEYAQKHYVQGGNNQLILATDGEFTGSQTSEPELVNQIRGNATKGIIMSIVGFGNDKDAISRLKRFAKHGEGQYLHIGSIDDSVDLLVEEVKKNSLKTN